MSPLLMFQVTTYLCLLVVCIKAFPETEEKRIFLKDKPQGVILQDGYQVVYPAAPADLSVVFSQAFQQIVGGVSTSLHAAVEYLTRVVVGTVS
ncbi:unnamed protein product [Nezara viridula]|uniref:Neuropeptide n=1 Tax=Nezara viridula TaxID=85310 RepID=A0A9P0HMR6_NEZVI|nr:unnamed protein product [Nezara viridula]